MPKIRRQNLPTHLLNHLGDRVSERRITLEDLHSFARWANTNPEVPEGKWFKKFTGLTVCGEGELVKTFLLPRQLAEGREVE